MIRLQTTVETGRSRIGISRQDKILVIGSCFADTIGLRLKNCGLDVVVNPFGTQYNPVSVFNSMARLSSGIPFTKDDCVEMGAGAGLVCAFSHHTSFARKTQEEFLENANKELGAACAFFKECNKVIITLGTSWVFKWKETGDVVSNCLKLDAKGFLREQLSISQVEMTLIGMLRSWPDKEFIFTVSPIRHMSDGAHGNQVSKARLLMAVDRACDSFPEKCEYFPAYEIMLDELRDYRFYAEDLCHPSTLAQDIIWGRFLDFAVSSEDREAMETAEKQYRRTLHIPHQKG